MALKYRGRIGIVGSFEFDDRLVGHEVPPQVSASYELTVSGLLRIIEKNSCGRLLLEAVMHQCASHHLDICRYRPAVRAAFPNAAAVSLDPQGSTPKGRPVRDDLGNPLPDLPLCDPVTEQGPRLTGKGGGAPAMLLFTPGHFHVCRSLAGMKTDEVLFHELVHAYRHLRGRTSNIGIGRKNKGEYPNREELLATCLSNIYISAKHSDAALRGDYFFPKANHTWNVPDAKAKQNAGGGLRTGYTYSESVMLENFASITQLLEEERPLLTAISRVDCTFNPFREYCKSYGAGTKPAYAASWH